ncbi:MAG: GDCCVxC domain-containing (seleno)protein [Marinibacterium sp.]
MPTDPCQWFYTCTAGDNVLKPGPGACCICCAHGTLPCPPIQEGIGCCGRSVSPTIALIRSAERVVHGKHCLVAAERT